MIFIDSPNYYSGAQTNRIYAPFGFGRGGVGSGRSGIYAFTGASSFTFPVNPLSGTGESTTATAGIAWQVPTASAGPIIQFGNIMSGLFVSFNSVGDGRIFPQVTLFGSSINGAPYGPFPETLPGQWPFVEFQCIADPEFIPPDPPALPEGYIVVHCNITLKINETLIFNVLMDTPHAPSLTGDLSHYNFSQIQWANGAAWDDPYVIDTSTFLGDGSNVVMYPNSDVETGWTPSGGAVPHYSMVNDKYAPGADDDATYVGATVSSIQDAYGLTPIPTFTGEIKAVQFMMLVRKVDSGTCSVCIELNEGAYESAPLSPSETYVYLIDGWTTNPLGGPLLLADVNNFKIGPNRLT